uniref:Uncharacterized protein n=1 Tax=Anopheles maculatus TaxID=74869 RepID=A0A182STL3_9DIPT
MISVEETSKLINTLKSGTQPIIRKRQIMRTTFGDYRSKMAAEEQTMAVNPDSVRFEKSKETTTKHTFLKKAAVLSGDKDFKFNFTVRFEKSKETTTKHTFLKKAAGLSGDKDFKFNFTVDANEPEHPTEAVPVTVDNKLSEVKTVPKTNVGIIVPSDNQFRFNFNVSSE